MTKHTQIKNFSHAELNMLYNGREELRKQDGQAYLRGLSAQQRLDRLKASPDFQRRYAENDPGTVDAFNHLVNLVARGSWTMDRHLQVDANAQAERIQAEQQEAASMITAEFQAKLEQGDPTATQAWRNHNARLAAAAGVAPELANPAPAASSPQPAPAGPTAVTN